MGLIVRNSIMPLSLAAAASLALLAAPMAANAATPSSDDALVAKQARDYPILAGFGTTADLAIDRPVTVAKIASTMPDLIANRARLLSKTESSTLLLVPRRDGTVCFTKLDASGEAGIDCNTAGGSPFLATYGQASGVVPVSVESVTFTLSDGSTQTTATPDGTWSAPSEAASISYGTGASKYTEGLLPASTKPAPAPAFGPAPF